MTVSCIYLHFKTTVCGKTYSLGKKKKIGGLQPNSSGNMLPFKWSHWTQQAFRSQFCDLQQHFTRERKVCVSLKLFVQISPLWIICISCSWGSRVTISSSPGDWLTQSTPLSIQHGRLEQKDSEWKKDSRVFLDTGSWEETGLKWQGYILHVVLDMKINSNNQEEEPVCRAHWNSHLVTFSANLVSRTVTRLNDSRSVKYECMPCIYGISVWKGCVYFFKGMNSICKLPGNERQRGPDRNQSEEMIH